MSQHRGRRVPRAVGSTLASSQPVQFMQEPRSLHWSPEGGYCRVTATAGETAEDGEQDEMASLCGDLKTGKKNQDHSPSQWMPAREKVWQSARFLRKTKGSGRLTSPHCCKITNPEATLARNKGSRQNMEIYHLLKVWVIQDRPLKPKRQGYP